MNPALRSALSRAEAAEAEVSKLRAVAASYETDLRRHVESAAVASEERRVLIEQRDRLHRELNNAHCQLALGDDLAEAVARERHVGDCPDEPHDDTECALCECDPCVATRAYRAIRALEAHVAARTQCPADSDSEADQSSQAK